jgi:hypothetical protein
MLCHGGIIHKPHNLPTDGKNLLQLQKCHHIVIFQQLGCTSKFSLDLAQGLVKDYFVLIPKAVSGLQDLPQLAPHFTANFLTAVAEMYGVVGEFHSISIARQFLNFLDTDICDKKIEISFVVVTDLLILWYLILVIPVTQCDAQNSKCQV